jgi:hypothetical protein
LHKSVYDYDTFSDEGFHVHGQYNSNFQIPHVLLGNWAKKFINCVRFEVLTAVNMKVTIFWTEDAARFFIMFIYLYQTIQHHITEC